jgi:hypothetical protein
MSPSSLDLAALRSLVERASDGPWVVHRCKGVDENGACGVTRPLNGQPWPIFGCDPEDECKCGIGLVNAAFIAASRTAVPALLDMVEALKAEAERLREERDVLASEHAECPDRQKAALALLSERAQLQEAFERATKETARLRARVERLEAAGRRWAKCYGPFYRMGGSGTEDGEAFEALMAALAPSPGEPSQLDGRAVQGVQKEKP